MTVICLLLSFKLALANLPQMVQKLIRGKFKDGSRHDLFVFKQNEEFGITFYTCNNYLGSIRKLGLYLVLRTSKNVFHFIFQTRPPWFVKQWRTPLNRCLYTAFSYMMFLVFIIIYVAEVQPPAIYWIDCLTAVWILSYTFRDIGTGKAFVQIKTVLSTLFILVLATLCERFWSVRKMKGKTRLEVNE